MYSYCFKSIKIGLVMHGWLFKVIYVAKLESFAILTFDPLQLKNVTNSFSINPTLS